METNHYDVVVVGDELGGLVTAALLGRRGLRVLVLSPPATAATFDAGGLELPVDAGLLPPLEDGPCARVFAELNDAAIVRRRAPPLEPSLQLALPGRRLDLPADAAALARELRRSFPDEHTELGAALARVDAVAQTLDPVLGTAVTLPPGGFWERREVARVEALLPKAGTDLLAPIAPDHPMRAALVALAALGTAVAPGDLGPVALARAVALARRGLHRVPGGQPALRKLLRTRIEALSGEFRHGTHVAEIRSRRGRIAALRLAPRDELVGVDHLVWAQPLDGLLGGGTPLIDEKQGRRLREIRAAVRPACYRYRLCVALHPHGLPEGMGPRVLSVRDPARPLLEGNAMLVTSEVMAGREGERAIVWAEALVPAGAIDPQLAYLTVARRRVLEHLSELMPFWERHLVLCASPHDGLPAEGPAAAPGPAPGPRRMPAAWSADHAGVLGVGAAPIDTGIPNLHLAGTEVLPGLGLEGDVVGGWSVAQRIAPEARPKLRGRRMLLLGD